MGGGSTCALRLVVWYLRGCGCVRVGGCGIPFPTETEARSVRNARQQTSSQPATCRYSNSGVRPAARSCPAVAHCLPSAGIWESAAPYGTLPTCLTTVPSHTNRTRTRTTNNPQMVVGLGGCLTDLDLSATLINRHGVAALAAGLPRLRRLKLNKCPGGLNT